MGGNDDNNNKNNGNSNNNRRIKEISGEICERVCHGEFRIETRCFPFQETPMTYQRRVLKTMETVDKTRTRFIPLNSSTSDGKYNCGMRVAE